MHQSTSALGWYALPKLDAHFYKGCKTFRRPKKVLVLSKLDAHSVFSNQLFVIRVFRAEVFAPKMVII